MHFARTTTTLTDHHHRPQLVIPTLSETEGEEPLYHKTLAHAQPLRRE